MGKRLFRQPAEELSEMDRLEKPIRVTRDEEGVYHPEWDKYSKPRDLNQRALELLYNKQDTKTDKIIQQKLLEAREASKSGDFERADEISQEIMDISRLRNKFEEIDE